MTGHQPDERLLAAALALAQRGLAKATIANAIARSPMEESTFWQRVKFKARLLRAVCAHGPATSAGGERAC